jgi:hypothetical protein
MTQKQRNAALRVAFVCFLTSLLVQGVGNQVAVTAWAMQSIPADLALTWVAFFGACTIGSFVVFMGILWTEVSRFRRDSCFR